MLQSNELEFLMEAHSGLSAKIVEEAGDNSRSIISSRNKNQFSLFMQESTSHK